MCLLTTLFASVGFTLALAAIMVTIHVQRSRACRNGPVDEETLLLPAGHEREDFFRAVQDIVRVYRNYHETADASSPPPLSCSGERLSAPLTPGSDPPPSPRSPPPSLFGERGPTPMTPELEAPPTPEFYPPFQLGQRLSRPPNPGLGPLLNVDDMHRILYPRDAVTDAILAEFDRWHDANGPPSTQHISYTATRADEAAADRTVPVVIPPSQIDDLIIDFRSVTTIDPSPSSMVFRHTVVEESPSMPGDPPCSNTFRAELSPDSFFCDE